MITVTAATGQLGRLVIADLLRRGVPADGIVAAVRTPAKAADLAALGVQVRPADYGQPAELAEAFTGTDRLLLISSTAPGLRVEQHRNAVQAAVDAGVDLLAYTSVLRADTSGLALAADHLATEDIIRASGVPAVLLRNGWYLENYTAALPSALAHGAILGAAGTGRVAAAARSDYAAAAAAVLTGAGRPGDVYELGGDRPFTMSELAAEVSRLTGRSVVYRDLPADDYAKALIDAGLPEPVAALLADSDLGAARGELDTTSDDLRRLIGRPTTGLVAALRTALGS